MYRYTHDDLEEAARHSLSVAETCRRLGIERPGGSTQTNIRNRLRREKIDTGHFLGQGRRRGEIPHNKRSPQEVLCYYPHQPRRERAATLRQALRAIGRPHACVMCKNIGRWMDQDLVLEVHHKDGDWLNNQADNLDFACPSCHQLLDRG